MYEPYVSANARLAYSCFTAIGDFSMERLELAHEKEAIPDSYMPLFERKHGITGVSKILTNNERYRWLVKP
jgi:hypothetical protein